MIINVKGVESIKSKEPNSLRSGSFGSFCFRSFYFFIIRGLYPFIKSALETTLTDERAIAPAAIAGFKSQPVKGYRIPAATGIPTIL